MPLTLSFKEGEVDTVRERERECFRKSLGNNFFFFIIIIIGKLYRFRGG